MKLVLSLVLDLFECVRRIKMDKILHPVSGEDGYFCTETEKILIDAILHDYSMNQLVLTSATGRGGEHD